MHILEIAGSGTIGTQKMGPISNDICQLSKRFSELNHDVTIADAATEGNRTKLHPQMRLVEIDSIARSYSRYNRNPNFLSAKNAFNTYLSLYNYWKDEYFFINKIASNIDFSKFDIIHIHESIPAIIFHRKFKYKYVYTAHTPTWCQIYNNESLFNNVKKVKIELLTALGLHEKHAIKNSTLTIGLGKYLKEHFRNADIKIIQNGIDLSKWEPIKRTYARRSLGYDQDDFIVLFVGRVLPIKGVHTLINAVKLIGSNLKNFYVIIIGSLGKSFEDRVEINPYAKKLITASKELPVEFKGFISNRSNTFKKFLSGADLLVLPSLFEPQGNVILEAMAMEVPVLASASGGIPDTVTNRVGRLFRPGDFKQLASLLNYFYFNREELLDLKKHCRSYVTQNFTWDISAKKHIDAFKHLIELN